MNCGRLRDDLLRVGLIQSASSSRVIDAETTERAELPGPAMIDCRGVRSAVAGPDVRIHARPLLAAPRAFAVAVTDPLVLTARKGIAAQCERHAVAP
jgi:hypothetical protein